MPDTTDDKPQSGSLLGIALIGCGGGATNYRSFYAAISGTAYRLVADRNEEAARPTAMIVGAERLSSEGRDALKPNIRLADIFTRDYPRTLQAVAPLGTDKSVLVAKAAVPRVVGCGAWLPRLVHSTHR